MQDGPSIDVEVLGGLVVLPAVRSIQRVTRQRLKGNAHLPPGEDEPLLWRRHAGLLLYFLLDTGDLRDGGYASHRVLEGSIVAYLVIRVNVQLNL
jgi:hypothetical protein